MKPRHVILSLIALVSSGVPLQAAPAFDNELTQLKVQHEQALGLVVEPVNRRYRESLESLLRRATQANDLETAVKIKKEIDVIPGPTPKLQTELTGKTFQFIRRGSTTVLVLGPDGVVQGNDNPAEAAWDVSEKGDLRFKDPTGAVRTVFDTKATKGGLLRFDGFCILKGVKTDIRHTLQEVRK